MCVCVQLAAVVGEYYGNSCAVLRDDDARGTPRSGSGLVVVVVDAGDNNSSSRMVAAASK